jgi:hypothetical protein
MPTVRRRLAVAALTLAAAAAGAAPAGAATLPGLKAEYFDYTDLTGKVAERVDQTVDFDWGQAEPVPGVGDDFSVRWTGVVTPRHSETYTLSTHADDGVRLWIDGRLVIDDWTTHSAAERTGDLALEAGRAYDLRLEYFDAGHRGVARLYWRSPSQAREIVPAPALASQAPGEAPAIDLPRDGGVPAAVPGGGLVPEALPPTLLPDEAAPAIVSYGGPLPPPAPPVAGATFNAAPDGGTVLIRRPADGQLIPLEQGASLPIGTRVDARDGAVEVQTAPAADVDRATQDARFHGGMFRVGQRRRGSRVVTIDLLHGEFAEVCGAARRGARRRGVLARAAGRRRVLRRLWGRGKGRFRTRGRHAAATVRGTEWSIADRCDETAIRVHAGIVDVENLLTGEVVTLRDGDRYAARG